MFNWRPVSSRDPLGHELKVSQDQQNSSIDVQYLQYLLSLQSYKTPGRSLYPADCLWLATFKPILMQTYIPGSSNHWQTTRNTWQPPLVELVRADQPHNTVMLGASKGRAIWIDVTMELLHIQVEYWEVYVTVEFVAKLRARRRYWGFIARCM
jgi:hypothetical protein